MRQTGTAPVPPLTLLDACAVINLYATRTMEPIVASVDGPVAVADVAVAEAGFVFRGGSGDDARERDPVDLQPLLVSGALSIIATTDEEELLTFIDLARDVGDGEAMTGALAIHRGGVVVTDDRKATRVLRSRGVALRTSLDLITTWVDAAAISPERVRAIVADVRQRASYTPHRTHPFYDWWDAAT
jgi:predicted nucleic acid-binding protein